MRALLVSAPAPQSALTRRIRARGAAAIATRLSPERTRRATLPSFVFLAARSLIGFARWRLQRELWRRDVRRLEELQAAERR